VSMCLPWCRTVAAASLAAVEGGILPPGPEALKRKCLPKSRAISAGQDARLYGRQDACRYGATAAHRAARQFRNPKALLLATAIPR
jgi:hypothetical protein